VPSHAPPPFWRRAIAHRSFLLGGILTVLLLFAAGLSLVWTPWSPYEIDMAAKLQAPSASHWLGTDPFGRDITSLLLVGARNSILVGVIAVGIGLLAGASLGLLAAARRGWAEELIMRLSDFTLAFPAILSAIMMTAVFGAGIVNSIIAIGIFNIPIFARITRASANALGLGTQPPQPSWGRMLAEAQTLLFQAPQLAVFPGVAIALAVLGLNLLGDGLSDLMDPRLARKR
jgi:peptide/nickel transport system permease protein